MTFFEKLKNLFRSDSDHAIKEGEGYAETIDLKTKVQELADEAKALGDEIKVKASPLLDSASQNSRVALEEISEKLQAASAQLHSKASELSSKAREMGKDKAAGRYLTVNILSKTDELIARRGEMVTYELLQKAEAEGKLDSVLLNTSKDPLE